MSVSYDFSGQTAIVTGGARGIGRAIVTQFVRSGAHVWIWDVDPIELEVLRNALTAAITRLSDRKIGHHLFDSWTPVSPPASAVRYAVELTSNLADLTTNSLMKLTF